MITVVMITLFAITGIYGLANVQKCEGMLSDKK